MNRVKYEMYTIRRRDLEEFGSAIPDYVLEKCSKKGFFVIGAVDENKHLIGMTQLYVRFLPEEGAVSDIVYVYVSERFRGKGVASRMIRKVHSIMKKSGAERCIAFMKKKQEEQQFFVKNGYLFTKAEDEMIVFFEEAYAAINSARLEQGVFFVAE